MYLLETPCLFCFVLISILKFKMTFFAMTQHKHSETLKLSLSATNQLPALSNCDFVQFRIVFVSTVPVSFTFADFSSQLKHKNSNATLEMTLRKKFAPQLLSQHLFKVDIKKSLCLIKLNHYLHLFSLLFCLKH